MQRFIVIGPERSGTTLLVCLLDSHPQIRCYGGIFNANDSRSINPRSPDAATLVERVFSSKERMNSPSRRFARDPAGLRAIGFKVHPLQWAGSAVEAKMSGSRDINILHVKRRSAVRMLISSKHAKRSGIWNSTIQKSVRYDRLRLSLEEIRQAAAFIREQANHIEQCFVHHRVYEVYYEGLDRRCEEVMAGVQDFLGVDVVSGLSTDTVKLGGEPLADLIVNYEELRREAAGTDLALEL